MKKLLSLFALLSTLLLATPAVLAWDGAVTGKIHAIDVAPGGNLGFRVTLVGAPPMCTGGMTWAYLNDTDSNYKVYVAVILLAKAQGTAITVYTTNSDAFCHIGYIAASN